MQQTHIDGVKPVRHMLKNNAATLCGVAGNTTRDAPKDAYLAEKLTVECETCRGIALSQWMTQPDLCETIVDWAGIGAGATCIEPACGTGNFVMALRGVGADVFSVEVDPTFAADMHRDFLKLNFQAGEKFEWCVQNPPYEDGLDGDFLAHGLDVADNVLALIRVNALCGQARVKKVWSRVTMCGVLYLPERPKYNLRYAETDSPRHDFCVTWFRAKGAAKPEGGTRIGWIL